MRFLADKHPAISGPYTFMEAVNSQSVDERLHELLELPVSAIATDHVITISAGSSLKEACGLLAQYKLKKIPVTENGKIAGMLSRSDVMRYAMESAL
jgi:DHA2 family lincomycin resistance protein-like MFS transporter